MNDTPGVDMSTGSLGQGISAAVGMAVAAKHWGDDYRTYACLLYTSLLVQTSLPPLHQIGAKGTG